MSVEAPASGRGLVGLVALLLGLAVLSVPSRAAAQAAGAGDTAVSRDSAGMAAIADPEVAARMDSARRAERQQRNAAVRSLRPGDRIRVRLGGRHILDGDLLNLVDGELVLRTGGQLPPGLGREASDGAAPDDSAVGRPPPSSTDDTVRGPGDPPPVPSDGAFAAADTVPARAVRVPVDAMERLWLKTGSSGRGAVWGMALGGALGAVGGYLADTASCDRQGDDCIFNGFDTAVVTGLGGALAGAGLGWLIGKSFPRWRLWYP